MLLFWLPLAAASAHIVEEFFWPGGFTAWYHRTYPEIASSASRRFIFWINAALLFGCFAVGIDQRTSIGPAFFLLFATLLGANGIFHLAATIRMRRYSPGVVTGTLLYIPMALYGAWVLVGAGRISIGAAAGAIAAGASYHFLSRLNHLRRAKAIEAKE
ncbi:MAG: HXXEE domain-containing protein [Acidobacteria bacterium]|nr:HXXEE domain-containing protein [Acidobacteriota bacterium]MBV9475619.1 HXXEE domain-containing protein [Acidobacteriota bacterium]